MCKVSKKSASVVFASFSGSPYNPEFALHVFTCYGGIERPFECSVSLSA